MPRLYNTNLFCFLDYKAKEHGILDAAGNSNTVESVCVVNV